jgi:hypothetical protein
MIKTAQAINTVTWAFLFCNVLNIVRAILAGPNLGKHQKDSSTSPEPPHQCDPEARVALKDFFEELEAG